ncbi:MAG: CusA/CzcA family heavy metal efflux RND transporter [Sphingobacterium sp.]|jgi:cobalt-zinc-cadmium resistance protein CzcA|nr:CusA/CzcA family heavy metal efflux RND transporter [Sphingobacterium sp.]
MKQLGSQIIAKRWVIATAFLLIALFGYYAWKQLSVEAYPDIADVSSQIVTQVPGLAAEEMEQQITIPIEQAINGLPGMEVMRSKTTFGLSMVTIVFKDGVDDYWARTRIQERLADLSLPYGATPGLDPLTSPTGEIFRYILESNTHDLRKLTELQNFVIIPKIKQVAGVADVTNFGGITTQFQIELDPKKLDQYETSLSEVVAKIEANNANAGGSMMNRGDQTYVIRGIGLIKSLDDLGNIVVKSTKGNRIYMRDLGQIKLGNLARKGALGYSDKRGANYADNIEGIVLLLKHENPSSVLADVNATVDELNNKILPEDVKIHVVLDRTSLVDNTLQTVSKTLLEGMVLVILVLILFLGSWRGALLVAITIPLSLLIAFILMHFTNIPANLLSLGAIDFGIIVDGSIVMLETILKKREEKPGVALVEHSLATKIVEVAKPIFFATIIIITAYLPLFAFERVEKKLFTPMAYTVGYALLGALAVSLLLIPGLAYLIYRKPQQVYHNRWLEKLTTWYHKLIKKIMLHPKQVFVPLIIVLLATGLLTTSVGKDFLPTLDEGSIWLQVSLPPGITVEKSKEMSDTLRARTLKYEEISYVMVQAGRNDDGTDAWTPSHFEVSVGLKPYKTWKWGKTKDDLINELAAEYAQMPGYNVAFSQPMIDGVMDKIAGAHSELVVKLFGDDLKETRRVAQDLITTLKNVEGAVDLAIDQEPPLPQLQVIVDRDKIAQYGLNISDVTDLIQIAIGGKAVSQVYQGIKVYDITCQYAEEERNSPEKIGNLMLYTDNGTRIPLAQVATIKLNTGESTISRERNSRQLTVRLNVRGRDLGTFLTEAQQTIGQRLKYDPKKIKLQWGGQFENQHRAYNRLAVIVPMTLAIIFILLYSTFGSFGQAGLLIGIVPLALFGGMLALNIRDMTLNVSSAVGFIALFGVAIQNGVLMLSQFNVLRKNGMSLDEAVIEGAFSRFRPVLMTATVAILGLLPASLATGIGSDVQRPLATVIVYGLLFSTLLTLFMLPPLYLLMERKRLGNTNSQAV